MSRGGQQRMFGKAIFTVHAMVAWVWSVQPLPEGPQQRLAGDAEQFVAKAAGLV